jgi:glycosyltransferase involved in cell wall biosynthesis
MGCLVRLLDQKTLAERNFLLTHQTLKLSNQGNNGKKRWMGSRFIVHLIDRNRLSFVPRTEGYYLSDDRDRVTNLELYGNISHKEESNFTSLKSQLKWSKVLKMNPSHPKVSIGLPVYNGENFLSEAIETILAQTYQDFELIISDNASDDRTEEICRAYAAKDSRIRYYRHAQNQGASWNFNYTFELARGEYFKWAAHDDICAPEFLAKCVATLDADPSISVCHSQVKVIDKEGKFYNDEDIYVKLTNDNVKLSTDSLNTPERFRDLVNFRHSCYQVFGLIRTLSLKQTPLIDKYAGSDRVLLVRLGLLGRFTEIPECLFYLRKHPDQSVTICSYSMHLYNFWHDPAKRGKITYPHWRVFAEYLSALKETPLSWQEKIVCYWQLRLLLLGEWKLGKMMAIDLLVAFIQILDRLGNIEFLEKIYSKMHQGEQTSGDGKFDNLIFGRYPRLGKTDAG